MSFVDEIIAVSNPEYLKKLTNDLNKGLRFSKVDAIALHLHNQEGLAQDFENVDGESQAKTSDDTWATTQLKQRSPLSNHLKVVKSFESVDYENVYPRFIDTVDVRVKVNNARITTETAASIAARKVNPEKKPVMKMLGGPVQSVINKTLQSIFSYTDGVDSYIINPIQNNATGEFKMTAEHATFLCQTPDIPYDACWEIINKMNQGLYDGLYGDYDIEFFATEVDCTRNVPGTLGTVDQTTKIAKTRIAHQDVDAQTIPYLGNGYELVDNKKFNGSYSHTFQDLEETQCGADDELRMYEPLVDSKPWNVRVKIYDKFKYNLEVKSVKGTVENALMYVYNPEYHNLQKAYTCPMTHTLGLSRVECTFKYDVRQKGATFHAGIFETRYLNNHYRNTCFYLVEQSMQSGFDKVMEINLRNSVVLVRSEGSDTKTGVALIRAINPHTGRANGIVQSVSGLNKGDTFETLARYCTVGTKPVDLYVVDSCYEEASKRLVHKVVGYAILPPDAKHVASLDVVGKVRASEAAIYSNKELNWDRVGLSGAKKVFYVEPKLKTARKGDLYSPDKMGVRVTKKELQKMKKNLSKQKARYAKRLIDLQKKFDAGIEYDDQRYTKWQELKFEPKTCFILGIGEKEMYNGNTIVVVAVSIAGTSIKWYSTNAGLRRLAEKGQIMDSIIRIDEFHDSGETYKGYPIYKVDGVAIDVDEEVEILTGKKPS